MRVLSIILMGLVWGACVTQVCVAQVSEEEVPPPAAKIVSIGPTIAHPGVQAVGDVVGVFPGDHVFSRNEMEKFIIIDVKGMGVGEVREELMKKVSKPGESDKFDVSVKGITVGDLAILEDEKATKEDKASVFDAKVDDNTKAEVVGP